MPVLYLTEQGATLRKEGDLLLVTKEGQELQKVPAIKVEQVVVLGNISLTTPVIAYLLQNGIDCVFCNSYGKYHGRLVSTESRFGLLRQRQLETTTDLIRKVAIAREMGPFGITCNVIRPAAYTRLTSWTLANMDRYQKQGMILPEIMSQIRALAPEAVAPLVVYLASDEAANINGYDLLVRGGEISILSQPVEVKTIYKKDIWTFEELCRVIPKTLACTPAQPDTRRT